LDRGKIRGKRGEVFPSLREEANNREKAREVYCPQDYYYKVSEESSDMIH